MAGGKLFHWARIKDVINRSFTKQIKELVSTKKSEQWYAWLQRNEFYKRSRQRLASPYED
jgi:hypothetical protein